MSSFTPTTSLPYSGLENESVSGETLAVIDSASQGLTGPTLVPASTRHVEPRTANSVLASSSVAELRFLRVDENEEVIHLSGRVRSFYHKQLAQEAIRPVAGNRQVINRVDVSKY